MAWYARPTACWLRPWRDGTSRSVQGSVEECLNDIQRGASRVIGTAELSELRNDGKAFDADTHRYARWRGWRRSTQRSSSRNELGLLGILETHWLPDAVPFVIRLVAE